MGDFIKEHSKEFWAGGSVGSVAGGGFLFAGPPLASGLVTDYLLKVCGALFLLVLSGFLSAIVADIYKYHIKPKFFKDEPRNKDNGKAA